MTRESYVGVMTDTEMRARRGIATPGKVCEGACYVFYARSFYACLVTTPRFLQNSGEASR